MTRGRRGLPYTRRVPADEPTDRAGNTGSSGAIFRGGVERVDATTPGVPPIPPRQPVAPSPSGSDRYSGSDEEAVSASEAGSSRPTEPNRPSVTATDRPDRAPESGRSREEPGRRGRVRARKVRRVLRHVEPWSVLKLSVVFYAALFLIVCVASALLWGVARSTGTVENVESFITSVGGFGNCEPIDGDTPVTTTTLPGATVTAPVDQLDPNAGSTTVPEGSAAVPASPGDDEDCRPGEKLVGEFKFEDGRIFQAFVLGGIVLVLAGSAANVVMVLLFNLMSDLTGGVRVTVLEEDAPARSRSGSGSPPPPRRG